MCRDFTKGVMPFPKILNIKPHKTHMGFYIEPSIKKMRLIFGACIVLNFAHYRNYLRFLRLIL